MRRYFQYRLDNPPLALVINLLPSAEEAIDVVKGHGMSMKVKIPKQIDVDLAYILGAIRDGGIHFDEKNNAYKIHFAQKNKEYLEKEISRRLTRLFNIDAPISKRKDGVHQLQFSSKPIYLLFAKVFGMKEVQQYWSTPEVMKNAPKYLKKEYIRGFYDAEGSYDHLYHSWHQEGKCPPLEFISLALNTVFGIKTTKPLRIKTDDSFDRFPAYQLYINDYSGFKREILGK
jgi:intein-encoded DNA endonuclease-like protein